MPSETVWNPIEALNSLGRDGWEAFDTDSHVTLSTSPYGHKSGAPTTRRYYLKRMLDWA
jgi:hypothetical protein